MEASDESGRLPIVLRPAMLCDEELYHPQIQGLRGLVEPVPLTVAESSMAEAAAVVLRQAPPRFLLAGTSYRGNLALEVVATALSAQFSHALPTTRYCSTRSQLLASASASSRLSTTVLA